jgi:arylsulfatase A-like enzyme
MARNILFITTDQQRFDALGCHGSVARTPAADLLASEGIDFTCAYTNHAVCMPTRTTMFTGQYPLTHGITANGMHYSTGEKGVARWLKRHAGYRTALIGKSHFEPMFDPFLQFMQNRLAPLGSNGPWMGFDHVELASHGLIGGHYTRWLLENHPEHTGGFAIAIAGKGGGETGAPELHHNPIPRELYHSDWIADRTIAHISDLNQTGSPWFIWMSFPDPHHPFDPPADELHRHNWRDLELPPGNPGSDQKCIESLKTKPRHWLDYYMGDYQNCEGAPVKFVPRNLTHDQIREINQYIHVENELIDEAMGRVLTHLECLGIYDDTDIFFTTDHGDLQGDFNFAFKGPFHTNSLLHIPFIYKPAACESAAPRVSEQLVSHVDLVPTFCRAAGVPLPPWAQGRHLPMEPDETRERVITTWDSQFRVIGMHMRTLINDRYIITAYLPSTRGRGGRWPLLERAIWGSKGRIPKYDGTEGELYDRLEDPWQWRNLWNDPAFKRVKSDLLADLWDNMPEECAQERRVVSPV